MHFSFFLAHIVDAISATVLKMRVQVLVVATGLCHCEASASRQAGHDSGDYELKKVHINPHIGGNSSTSPEHTP